jgi:lysylphosphatidylglycerol synthetase-like protein (DUF2156 family)
MEPPGTMARETDLLHLLKQHGSHSLAYATLQPGMGYWGHPSTGYAAYRRTLGQYTFLGDPVCAGESLGSFLAEVVAAFPGSLFMQIHQPTARALEGLGYRITPVGVENDIDTFTFSLAGKRKADLRHYRNKAQTAGITVSEASDSNTTRASLRTICDAWLPLKSWINRELEFLARPFLQSPEPGTRIFTARIGNALVAFVVLDPIFEDKEVVGYSVSILRHLPEAPEGCVDAIVLEIIRRCAAEGVARLSLGVSPFHRIEEISRLDGRGALPVYGLYLALRRWGDPIYHFRGLSFHKSRYRARETPVYTAAPGPISLWPLYASARACRML